MWTCGGEVIVGNFFGGEEDDDEVCLVTPRQRINACFCLKLDLSCLTNHFPPGVVEVVVVGAREQD